MKSRKHLQVLQDESPTQCARMPEAVAEIVSERYMPQLSEATRNRMRVAVERIEGSTPDQAITCISEKDYPAIAEKLAPYVEEGILGESIPAYIAKHTQGIFRALNKHCDECLRQDCENRVALTREDIALISQKHGYTNSRRAKANPPAYQSVAE